MTPKQVRKKSGKPFKSRQAINTVAGIVTNPYTNKDAYIFLEDDSIVDCVACEEIKNEKNY